ncbi:protein toll-like isoform X1 [Bombyx mandarina]|uniref:Protein toll-like isoform X1 n=1 Tax=Bombyx mandarina TaxID=7092 RepID=A0A6J2JSJ3_BOMMA|nr:protein toll-like isoform X1 [Bombyx mandarina]
MDNYVYQVLLGNRDFKMLILLLLALASVSACPEQCWCTDGEELNYQCSRPSTNLIVGARPRDYVNIDCMGGELVCAEFPEIDTPATTQLPSLSLRECSLPPLSCLLQKVHAEDVKTVVFKNAINPLNADAFKGLGITALMMFNAGAQTTVPVDVLRSLPKLTHFRLNAGRNITLHANMFANTPPLKYLELSDAKITVLPDDAFLGLNVLEQLNVWGNELANITAGAFRGLHNVTVLSLNKNRIQALPAGLFASTPRLLNLTMISNSFRYLDSEIFRGLDHIQEIKISNNVPLTLKEAVFSNLPALRTLQLDLSSIRELPEEFISNSPLRTLSLARNQLRALPRSVLRGQTQLTSLTLSYNAVAELAPELFADLRALETFVMDGNELQVLPDSLFSGLRNLTTVSLRNNKISVISMNTFQGATSIRTLDLSYNRLAFAPDSLYSPLNQLHKLQTLTLAWNNITSIYDDWRYVFVELVKLDLSGNAIGDLTDSDLHFFSEGVTVDLQHNNVSTVLMSGVLRAANATVLLQHNPLACDCSLYSLLDWLAGGPRSLRLEVGDTRCAGPAELGGYRVTDVPPASLYCAVPCGGCSCRLVPGLDAVQGTCARDVTTVDPQTYGVTTFSLRLQHAAPPALAALPPYVRSLDLSALNLTELPCNVSESLTRLDLSDNALAVAPSCLLRRNVTVRLAGNPLACDCRHAEEVALLAAHRHLVEDYENVTCAGQERLEQVDAARLCDVVVAALVGGCLAAAGALLVAGVVLFHRYRLEVLAWLHARRPRPRRAAPAACRYDVLVSSAEGEAAWGARGVRAAERGGLRACWPERDWAAGELLPARIAASLHDCRAALLFVSRSYMASPWCRLTFLLAQARAAHVSSFRVVVVLLEEPGPEERELRAYLAARPPLKPADPLLWEKVLYKLRPRRASQKKLYRSLVKNGLQLQLDVEGKLTNPAFVKDHD